MSRYFIRSFACTWALILVGIFLLATFQVKSSMYEFSRPTSILYPPASLKYFSLGYSELIADVIWIRAIQDFDRCEQSNRAPGAPVLPWIGEVRSAFSRCDEGWVYQMVNATTELAPRFQAPYTHGATMLSIVVDDRTGAKKIFEKGVERFPRNWMLRYGLGYHYLYEIGDLPNAAMQLQKAAEYGAPPWVYALAANIYSKTGQAQLGISILEDALAKDPQGPGAERIQYRLNILKAELAKARTEETTSSTRK